MIQKDIYDKRHNNYTAWNTFRIYRQIYLFLLFIYQLRILKNALNNSID